MTGIDFHFNAADKVSHTCRLIRKALGTGARVVVAAEGETLDALDLALWQFSPDSFIAHCRIDADERMVRRSPVVLAGTGRSALPHQQVLINLAPGVPEGFERFERLIEIVTPDDEDRQAGRERWRHYATRGYTLQRHDLAGGAA
ncbi:MAG: DNA polymerase III subunit chi [Comamonadaceae bacterium]|nr:MAG: DNA polymerase III subunit chi [Comamonadaceae bacterium]